MVKLSIDDKIIEAKEGTTLLQTCLNNDIYIPNLCYLEDVDDSPASCRMCFVEIGGEEKPVTSCKIPVKDNMVVKTDTPSVRELQRTALRLLLSVHHTDCKRCRADKKCELQHIAKFLDIGLRSKPLERYLKETDIDQSHTFLDYYSNRCVLCGKCIHACRKKHGQSIMTFAKRGFDTTISFYGKKDVSSPACEECYACIEICPVGALETRA